MPSNEKEYNGNLFDQLSILERIEAVTTDEAALKQIAIERKQIERKLYQKPPLIEQNWIMSAIKRMSVKWCPLLSGKEKNTYESLLLYYVSCHKYFLSNCWNGDYLLWVQELILELKMRMEQLQQFIIIVMNVWKT